MNYKVKCNKIVTKNLLHFMTFYSWQELYNVVYAHSQRPWIVIIITIQGCSLHALCENFHDYRSPIVKIFTIEIFIFFSFVT